MRCPLLRLVAIASAVLFFGVSPMASCAQTHEPRIPEAKPHTSQVLFVCEHGNVKSLMAASYFNQQAQQAGLPYRAVSRGITPDSTTVPPTIVEGLRVDGIDVSGFHPSAVKATDVAASQRVVTIGATLPVEAQGTAGPPIEQWNDVPPTSQGFARTQDALKVHVRKLIEQLAKR
jgi:protein-tyrosine-phosphatase